MADKFVVEFVDTPTGRAVSVDGGKLLYSWAEVDRVMHLGAEQRPQSERVPLMTSADMHRPPVDEKAPETTPEARCAHEGAKWEVENRFLVCPVCKAELRPGICLACGRPAGGTSRDGTVFSTEGFSCARCRDG